MEKNFAYSTNNVLFSANAEKGTYKKFKVKKRLKEQTGFNKNCRLSIKQNTTKIKSYKRNLAF